MSKVTYSVAVPPFEAGRRRRFSDEEKRAIIIDAFRANETLSSVSRRFDLAVGLLYRWQKNLGISRAAVAQSPAGQTQAQRSLEERVAALELELMTLAKEKSELEAQLGQTARRPSGANGTDIFGNEIENRRLTQNA